MAEKKNGKVVEIVEQLARPVAQAQGLDLWDVRFVREGASWFLRIFIDKPDGVTLDDCERFHRAVDPLIDEADPVEQSYFLEVSSPGIERELRRPAHFAASLGKRVRVRLFRPDEGGARELLGVLRSAGESSFTLAHDGGPREISYAQAAWVRLADDDVQGGIESNE